MLPFMVAFSLTYFLVTTAQDAAVKCECWLRFGAHVLTDIALLCFALAETFANDPRNPYALKVSKQSNAHH